MGIIFGILAFLVIGGIVLRFSRQFRFPVWKAVICLGTWIIGGITIFTEGEAEGFEIVLSLAFVAVLPFLIIFGLKILGKAVKWALGGWSQNDGDSENQ